MVDAAEFSQHAPTCFPTHENCGFVNIARGARNVNLYPAGLPFTISVSSPVAQLQKFVALWNFRPELLYPAPKVFSEIVGSISVLAIFVETLVKDLARNFRHREE